MKKEARVPEVDAFEAISEEIEEFKSSNAAFYQELQSLAERYNAAHEMAFKAVRSKRVSCGPFQLMGRPAVKYDPNKIIELFGESVFKKYGGRTKQVTVYEVDKEQMDVACASGLISQEEIDTIREIQPRYRKPEKLVLP